MQHPTSRPPVPADDLPWSEQMLIRLDEIVGLLDSIDHRLVCWEKGNGGAGCQPGGCQCVECQSVGCHYTQITGHLTPDTPTPAQGEEPPQ
ncbi:MAG: hypothetical protein HY328_11880 [Chloroflexi bacterium]|nr:hypothetical protein [Chloroflexota bacterium]